MVVRAQRATVPHEQRTTDNDPLLPHHPHCQVAHHRAVEPAAPPHAGDRAAVAATEEMPVRYTENATQGHGADRDPHVPHGAKVGVRARGPW